MLSKLPILLLAIWDNYDLLMIILIIYFVLHSFPPHLISILPYTPYVFPISLVHFPEWMLPYYFFVSEACSAKCVMLFSLIAVTYPTCGIITSASKSYLQSVISDLLGITLNMIPKHNAVQHLEYIFYRGLEWSPLKMFQVRNLSTANILGSTVNCFILKSSVMNFSIIKILL